jgi:alpha-tubulin suppressor-like RCC1 family protein
MGKAGQSAAVLAQTFRFDNFAGGLSMSQPGERLIRAWAWLLLCFIALPRAAADSTALGVGMEHTCAVLSDGSVRCWGINTSGELGNGTTSLFSPTSVSSLGGAAVAIASGWSHTCALLSDGSVQCWGDNALGALGDGTWGTSMSTHGPVSVVSLGGTAVAIAAGMYSSCALLSDGSVRCWGNASGLLGDGSVTDTNTPVSVMSLGGTAVAIATRCAHACALLSDGSVRCWGGTPLQVL